MLCHALNNDICFIQHTNKCSVFFCPAAGKVHSSLYSIRYWHPDKAQDLLDSLPSEPTFDRRQLQATLYMQQERWEDAAKLAETGLLQDSARLHTALLTLLEVAQKEQRPKDADHLAQVSLQLARLLDQNVMFGHSLRLQKAVHEKDAEAFLDAAKSMLKRLLAP